MRETLKATRRHRASTRKAASRPVWASIMAILSVVVLGPATAQAGQWSLLVNGKAIHLDEQPGVELNEENWGAGVQYDFNMTENKWVPFLNASGFKDSNNNPSYYAGGGTVRRFQFGENKNSLHLDIGAVAFLMVREDFNSGNPFPGVLPVASVGTKRVALNVTYIPKIDPKMVPLVFFQLKIGLY